MGTPHPSSHTKRSFSIRPVPRQSLPETHLKVKVQPRASANKIAGFRDGVLLVRVTAPPEKGQANAAVIALLADALGVAKTSVHITRGHNSREKLVAVDGLEAAEVEGILSTSG